MNKVTLILGSNLGDTIENIFLALSKIVEYVGEITTKSSLYETKAWGKTDQPNFLNLAIQLNTSLTPFAVLKEVQKIETECGRLRKEKWGERTMDIDVLFYNDLILKTDELTIPHPLIEMRKFVLMPLAEIDPDLTHPISKQKISKLLLICNDDLEVKKLKNVLH